LSPDLVSIVIVTYNSKNFLHKCIKSISGLDYSNFELIIIDNNSTDGTRQILAEINLKNTDRVKVILNSKNLGYNAGNKIGIDNSNGNYIAFVNPDVVLEKSWLTNVLNILKKENLVAVSGKTLSFTNEIKTTGGIIDIYGATKQRKSEDITEQFFYNPGAAFIFKKEVLEKLVVDPTFFLYYEDVDFSWQLRLLGYDVGYCEKAIAYHAEGHSLPKLPPVKWYHISKNRIYLCMKNYSMNRIIRRLYKIIFLLISDSIFYSIKHKSIQYFFVTIGALFWNILKINHTRRQRIKIQSLRRISDNDLEQFMLKKSIEIEMLKTMV